MSEIIPEHVMQARQPDQEDQILGKKYNFWVRAGQLEGDITYDQKKLIWTAGYSRPATDHEIKMWQLLRDNWRTLKIFEDESSYLKSKLIELTKFKQDTLVNQYGAETVAGVDLG